MAGTPLFGALRRALGTRGREHTRSRRRTAQGVVALVLVVLAVAGSAAPAGAHHMRAYHTEADMVADGDADNRATFVIDPGQNHVAGRSQLLANRALYARFGFSENFLWYAPETERVVDAGARWATCGPGGHSGGACPAGSVETGAEHTVGHTFGGSTRLRLYEYGGSFIARACGNFSTGRDDVPEPVPTITGRKFRDANRDGVRQAGEAWLPGWGITITRVRSDAGQATGPVATLATDADGRYRFRLDGEGPGLYRVTEASPDGWRAYTPASHDVEVPFGAGDATYTRDFGNAETTTDVEKVSFGLVDPPTRLEKDEPADLLVRSEIVNHGPAGPIEVDEELTLVSAPEDCTVDGLPPRRRRTLDVGGTVTLDETLTVTCTHRSNHRFELRNDVGVGAPEEVTDVDTTNNTATIDVTIPVFEQTELGLDQPAITCDQYWAGDPFTCTASARVTNAGDAEAAELLAGLELAGGDGCTTTPDRRQDRPVTLDGGASETVTATWTVTCPGGDLRTFRLDADVAVDEPHLEAEPRTASLTWQPIDIKPDSDPNSLNIGRPGLVSVAILSTVDLDASAVDATTLRFGPTGTEAPVVRCGAPEDANHDGRDDLVCKFQLRDAGFSPGDTLGLVTGTLTTGEAFAGADRVRIV